MTSPRDRSLIADTDKWDLAHLYASDGVWKKEKENWKKRLDEIPPLQGRLHRSARDLADGLNLTTELSKTFMRLYSYAHMSSDQDTRVSAALAMEQEMQSLGAEFSATCSFIEPEILAMEPSRIDRFLEEEPALADHRHYLEDLIRRKAHTGTESEERIIATAGLMSDNAQNIYSIFSNADFPYPHVTLSDGSDVKLDHSSFAHHRTSKKRDDRKNVFETFFGELNKYRRTFGAQLSGELRKNIFYTKVRKYNSCLERALDGNNIPTSVVRRLIEGVRENLTSFHRYLKLRERILGLDVLHYYDLYVPLVEEGARRYTYDEAREAVVRSLAPLGQDYTEVVQRSFRERWIDVYPTEGKRSGAYATGSAYDVHPYLLLNYQGKYDDVSTLAHEMGHAMHSYLSNRHQPYPTSHYSIFVAEVASTFNEALLLDFMLKSIKDDRERLALLGSYLEGIKGTVFRQTQFAEFELAIHERAEKGDALTGDEFNEMYLRLVREYYGHDQNVCLVDDHVQIEWAYIPHFYYNFYVYQYATSYTASAALSEKAIAGDTETIRRYIELLSSGGCDYSIPLLKKAGVDMTTDEPLRLTMQKMNRVMDEIEAILEKL
jgi:oligoendopeptidase F